MRCGPALPEGFVVRASVKEDGEFAELTDYPSAMKDVAKKVDCEMAKVVYGVEAWKRETGDLSSSPALPK